MEKRIQALEEIILGKVDQGSTGGDLREENLLEGLKRQGEPTGGQNYLSPKARFRTKSALMN